MSTVQEQIRAILDREADFLARQLEARCKDGRGLAIAAFEAKVRPVLLDVLEDAANLNRTRPLVGGGCH